MPTIDGVLFDKDGTLFDFQSTWGGWAADLMLDLARQDAALADHLAERIRIDRSTRRFHPDSPMIAGSNDDAADVLLPALPHLSRAQLIHRMIDSSRIVAPVEAVPLAPLLARLRGAGLTLGVATNDAEAAAVDQLQALDVLGQFELVVGADSGHGAKPAPGQCHAFAQATGLPPEKIAMIGDSTHDLHAASAAGMVAVAVLTGPATHDDLTPHADVVLPDISHLPRWLGLG